MEICSIASDEMRVDIKNLAVSLRRELESLQPLSGQSSICRVPERLRQSNKKAYTPQIISIGPLHHGRKDLKTMEEYKHRYLKSFLQRTEVSLEDFFKTVKEKEARIRNCYAEIIELKSNEFVKMILVDAAFVVEYLLKYSFMEINYAGNEVGYNEPWMLIDVNHDMLLLENQLPFFILEDFFCQSNIAVISFNKDDRISLLKIVHKFCIEFCDFLGLEENLDEEKYSGVEHLVDFLRTCVLSSHLHVQRRPKILTTPNATDLHQAGVKFEVGSSKNLLDIRFHNGILEIPQIKIRSPTEFLLRNLLAFEQCHCFDYQINDFIVIINYLVNSSKDVELLVRSGIIENRLRDNEAVSTLFHNLVDQTTLNVDFFYYSLIVEDLNRYCTTTWHKWKATLKQDYFNTPWATVSVIAAVVLLTLTFIQAICSILSL